MKVNNAECKHPSPELIKAQWAEFIQMNKIFVNQIQFKDAKITKNQSFHIEHLAHQRW